MLFSSNPVIVVGSILPGPSEGHLMVPAEETLIVEFHAQVAQGDEVPSEGLSGSPLPIQSRIPTSQLTNLVADWAILPNGRDCLPFLRVLVCEFVDDLLLVS